MQNYRLDELREMKELTETIKQNLAAIEASGWTLSELDDMRNEAAKKRNLPLRGCASKKQASANRDKTRQAKRVRTASHFNPRHATQKKAARRAYGIGGPALVPVIELSKLRLYFPG